MLEDKDFNEALSGKKIPILVLDQKWHQLFALGGKPDHVIAVEQSLNKLLEKQGQLNNDVKDMKKLKKKLMDSIVANMEGTHEEKFGAEESMRLDENRRMIDELNVKIESAEDTLKDIPRDIESTNRQLMLLTMDFCYGKLHTNLREAQEISDWIAKIRKELKMNLVRKQNREINGRQIYSYLHDIFGMEIINLFDLKYEEVVDKFEKAKNVQTEKSDNGG